MKIIVLNREENRLADLEDLAISPIEYASTDYSSVDFKFTFSYPSGEPGSEFLVEENKIAVQDLDGNFQLYKIVSTETIIDNREIIMVECLAAFYELTTKKFVTLNFTSDSANFAMTQVLLDTGWEVGTVEPPWTRSTSVVYQSPFNALAQIADIWEGELQFRVTISGTGISGKYVDLVTQLGNFIGKRFELGYDMEGIKILYETRHIQTALYGWGLGQELDEEGNTVRLDFKAVEWIKGEPAELYPGGPTSPAPADKPLGQEWVGDEDARLEYGDYNATTEEFEHKFGEYESQAQYPESLLWETWRQLTRRKIALMNAEASVAALEEVAGFEHEKIRLGDSCIVKLPDSEPLLARVIRIDRHRKDPQDTLIELGNFRPTISSTVAELRDSIRRVSDRSGIWDNANAFNPDGTLDSSVLSGIIDTVNNQILAGGGTVIIDGDGLSIYDTDDPATALGVIRGVSFNGEAALVLGKRDSILDPWQYGVGMTSDGFKIYGEEIIGGTIKADVVKIEGDTRFYWDGAILYVIDPADANKQIRFGKYDGTNYGLAYTGDGGVTFRTIIEEGYINVDAIEVGSLTWDHSQGGTLTLGGVNNQHGVFKVLNADDPPDEIAILDAELGGFHELFVGHLSAPNVALLTDEIGPKIIYVSSSGNDETGNGSVGSPYRTVNFVLSKLNHFLRGDISITVLSNLTENIHVKSLHGEGSITLSFMNYKLTGSIRFENCTVPINIFSVLVRANESSDALVYIDACNMVDINGVKFYGTGYSVTHGVYCRKGTASYVRVCEMYDVSRAIGFEGVQGFINNCKGLGSTYGYRSNRGALVVQSGTAPGGSTAARILVDQSQHFGDTTIDLGAATPPAPPEETVTWASNNSGYYTYQHNIWATADPLSPTIMRVGNPTGYGPYLGAFWINNTDYRSVLSGRTIVSARVRLYRYPSGGSSGASNVVMVGISNSSKSGAPSGMQSYGTIGTLAWGETKTFTIPNQAALDLRSGLINAIAFYHTSQLHYMILHGYDWGTPPQLSVTHAP